MELQTLSIDIAAWTIGSTGGELFGSLSSDGTLFTFTKACSFQMMVEALLQVDATHPRSVGIALCRLFDKGWFAAAEDDVAFNVKESFFTWPPLVAEAGDTLGLQYDYLSTAGPGDGETTWSIFQIV